MGVSGVPSSSCAPDLPRVLALLHEKKTAAYGDAWRKRGELLSIFPNVARKYDRLEKAAEDGELESAERGVPTRTAEPLLDTIADLVVYAVKYLGFLAEHEPASFPPGLAASSVAEFGPALVEVTIRASGGNPQKNNRLGLRDRFDRVADAMQRVEQTLLGTTAGATTPEVKTEAVLAVAVEAMSLLDGVARCCPQLWSSFACGVDEL